MATLGQINFIHSLCCVFPTDLRHSSRCQHHSSFMSIISSYSLTALTPAFSLLKLPPSGTAVLYLSTSFTCHLCANLCWKHSFFPLPPIPFSPIKKAARGQQHARYARCYKPCLLHKTAICGHMQHCRGQKTVSKTHLKTCFLPHGTQTKPTQTSCGCYTHTDNKDTALQIFEGVILHGYLVTRVKLRGEKRIRKQI